MFDVFGRYPLGNVKSNLPNEILEFILVNFGVKNFFNFQLKMSFDFDWSSWWGIVLTSKMIRGCWFKERDVED